MDTSGIMDSVLGALSMSFVLGLDEMLYLGAFAMTKNGGQKILGPRENHGICCRDMNQLHDRKMQYVEVEI